MRFSLMRSGGACLAAVLFSMAACSTSNDGGDDDGGGGAKVNGWSAMPLLDDASDPNQVVHHQGNDRVTGIYFESADKGYIVTQEGSRGVGEDRGGAVFLANGSEVTSVGFNGNGTGLTLIGSVEFTGIQPTPTGYVAMAYASDVIQSTDGGKTFNIDYSNDNHGAAGIERALGYQVTSTGTTMVFDSGKVSLLDHPSSGYPTLTDVWAPDAMPKIPLDVRDHADWCQHGPYAAAEPTTRYNVHISSDRQFIAYTSNHENDDPKICISHDGGSTFTPHELDVDLDSNVAARVPAGVLFPTPQIGISWFADPIAGKYIQRSTDGGETWHKLTLPAGIESAEIELPVGFFAPDGQHLWLAGYDHAGFGSAVLLTSADAGATWSTVDGVGDAVEQFKGDKLYAGFALDATHVWLGGEGGLVMHN